MSLARGRARAKARRCTDVFLPLLRFRILHDTLCPGHLCGFC